MSLNKESVSIINLIQFNEQYEKYLALPNRLFNYLKQLIQNNKLKKEHLSFTYSYIYFMTYMYRYAKYQFLVPKTNQIKQLFGYSLKNQQLDYIIKKNGILEPILMTTNNFPIFVEYEYKQPKFTCINDIKHDDNWQYWIEQWKKNLGVTNRSTCKLPVFGFHYDYKQGYNENEVFDGSFYETYDMTIVDFRIFDFCMSKPDELGVQAFYIYCWLKWKNEKHNKNFKSTRKRLSDELMISEGSVYKYISFMKRYRLIDTTNSHSEANAYKINDFEMVVKN